MDVDRAVNNRTKGPAFYKSIRLYKFRELVPNRNLTDRPSSQWRPKPRLIRVAGTGVRELRGHIPQPTPVNINTRRQGWRGYGRSLDRKANVYDNSTSNHAVSHGMVPVQPPTVRTGIYPVVNERASTYPPPHHVENRPFARHSSSWHDGLPSGVASKRQAELATSMTTPRIARNSFSHTSQRMLTHPPNYEESKLEGVAVPMLSQSHSNRPYLDANIPRQTDAILGRIRNRNLGVSRDETASIHVAKLINDPKYSGEGGNIQSGSSKHYDKDHNTLKSSVVKDTSGTAYFGDKHSPVSDERSILSHHSPSGAAEPPTVLGELWLDTLPLQDWLETYLSGEIGRASLAMNRDGIAFADI